jgi:hypothetical protein
MSSDPTRRTLHLDVPIDSVEDRRALRGALLGARATELGELQRRAGRLSFGYGSDSARDSMSDETANLRRRWEMLDRLIAALDAATRDDRGDGS